MNKKKSKFDITTPLSWMLFINLKELYFSELTKALVEKKRRNKLHCESIQAISAFPLAVATWEAILNEHFTSSPIISYPYKDNLLFGILKEADKWDIKTKTLMYPKFLFGKTFDTSQAIFSDFSMLLQIRNNIVHYKHGLDEGPDKAINYLRQKKITYPLPKGWSAPWHLEISSTECIRFCINIISEFAKQLSTLETDFYKKHCHPVNTNIYSEITNEHVLIEFKKNYIDPKTLEKDFSQTPIN